MCARTTCKPFKILQHFQFPALAFALVQFSTSIRTEVSFGQVGSEDELRAAVFSIEYLHGWSRTDLALDAASTLLTSRPAAARSQAVLLVTDGVSNNPPATTLAAQALHDDDVTVVAVGVGSAVRSARMREELVTISGSEQNSFEFETFDAMRLSATEVAMQICQGQSYWPTQLT